MRQCFEELRKSESPFVQKPDMQQNVQITKAASCVENIPIVCAGILLHSVRTLSLA